MDQQQFLLMIEGNIGAGKTTFLRLIQEQLPEVSIIFEPVDQWQTMENGDNLLDLFYKDMPRWAYTFQTYAFISRIKKLIQHQKNSIAEFNVMERSVYCDRFCFAKNCFENGTISALEWHLYKDLFAWLVRSYAPVPAGFVYLQATPETCNARVNKRSRSEEQSIPLTYLQALHQRHEDWLIHRHDLTPELHHVPVLTLDCNGDFEKDTDIQVRHLEQLTQFMATLREQRALVTAASQVTPWFDKNVDKLHSHS